jgi:predicted transposase YbfD/YdcC
MSTPASRSNLLSFINELDDPRSPLGKLHSLETIITVSLVAMICGADEWVEIEAFGNAKLDLFQQYFGVATNGIPSHDTFGRVFRLLDPLAFQASFRAYTQQLASAANNIAIDGKTMRGSHDTYHDKSSKHIVSAWANESRLVLAQVATSEKSNEITAIPELLGLLQLDGCVVTIDAMGAQKAIAQRIVEGGADYVLAVKGNQPELKEEVTDNFEKVGVKSDVQVDKSVNGGHGRVEIRTYQACTVENYLTPQLISQWPELKSMIMVDSYVEFTNGRRQGESREERRFFISSLEADQVTEAMQAIRSHWGIENSLHYVLDVAFREDHNRTRMGHAAVNQAVLRHFALNQLQQEKSAKLGVKAKRKKAGWDNEYLLKVLRSSA